MTATLKLVSWNTKVGRKHDVVARELRQIIKRHRPDVIALQEVSGYASMLRREFRKDWRVIVQTTGHAERRSNALLVRKRLRVYWTSLLSTAVRWRGPIRGLMHTGRTFPVVDVKGGWRICCVHRVPAGLHSTNKARHNEWARENVALLKLAKRRKSRKRALVLVGDWNAGAGDDAWSSPARLAKRINARVVRTGASVDYAIVTGCTGNGSTAGRYGSDHPVTVFSLIRGES